MKIELRGWFDRTLTRSAASGWCLLGISGAGKSVATDYKRGALNLRAIERTQYKECDFGHLKLALFKLDCSHNNSARALCANILEAIDKNLGKNSLRKENLNGNYRA
jgi:hypothetical protein